MPCNDLTQRRLRKPENANILVNRLLDCGPGGQRRGSHLKAGQFLSEAQLEGAIHHLRLSNKVESLAVSINTQRNWRAIAGLNRRNHIRPPVKTLLNPLAVDCDDLVTSLKAGFSSRSFRRDLFYDHLPIARHKPGETDLVLSIHPSANVKH